MYPVLGLPITGDTSVPDAEINYTILARIEALTWMRKFRKRDLTPSDARQLGLWLNANPLHIEALEYAMTEALRKDIARNRNVREQLH